MIFAQFVRSVRRSIYPLRQITAHNITRTLYSDKFMGICNYEEQRLLQSEKPFDWAEFESLIHGGDEKLLRDTTKKSIYVVNKNVQNILLIQTSLRRMQDEKRADFFRFGPIVMRMLHYLNLPDIALQFYEDTHTQHMFNELSSILVLCDLLFENSKYEKVFEICSNRRELNSKYINGLLTAACYKLNTEKHLNYALDLWQRTKDSNEELLNTANILALLACNQGRASLALQILPESLNAATISVRLKALLSVNDYATVALMLSTLIETKGKLPSELVDMIAAKLSNDNITNPSTEQVKSLHSEIIEKKMLLRVSIEETVFWPIIY